MNRYGRTSRRFDQRLTIGLYCGGLQTEKAFYFIAVTGCMGNCSLCIQAMPQTPKPFIVPSRRSRGRVYSVRSGRAPATHRAFCPVAPVAVASRPGRALAVVFRVADCRADPPAAVRPECPVSGEGFPAVRSAFMFAIFRSTSFR